MSPNETFAYRAGYDACSKDKQALDDDNAELAIENCDLKEENERLRGLLESLRPYIGDACNLILPVKAHLEHAYDVIDRESLKEGKP